MNCMFCKRQIPHNGIIMSSDGDFVCDIVCQEAFYREMNAISSMTDEEFYSWMGIDNA